ncbi:Plug domain-containing protein [Pseudoalteromonas luteoviolacea]|uniref:Plug domain-containing protein n=1 Tax=Pseudoalteromonas luteoviolacea TaxID=43657 RepID=UPI001F2CA617|nr:Plug domain-containing protein [Pseudoalteromonas luteoviolacea]MCF6442251.1 Plug domain-containing protein [Pseudoalteromonas luteoviolacea]
MLERDTTAYRATEKRMYRTRNILSLFMSMLSMMFLVPEIRAEEVPALESQVFDRAFFEQYHPQTALDMIYRLPGFSFQNTSSARGFGANVGNVLINGARPVVKSEKLSNVLNRLPAASVQQIRIYRGSQIPSVAAGNAVVADVISLDLETSEMCKGS